MSQVQEILQFAVAPAPVAVVCHERTQTQNSDPELLSCRCNNCPSVKGPRPFRCPGQKPGVPDSSSSSSSLPRPIHQQVPHLLLSWRCWTASRPSRPHHHRPLGPVRAAGGASQPESALLQNLLEQRGCAISSVDPAPGCIAGRGSPTLTP